jgi:hypothetical protein
MRQGGEKTGKHQHCSSTIKVHFQRSEQFFFNSWFIRRTDFCRLFSALCRAAILNAVCSSNDDVSDGLSPPKKADVKRRNHGTQSSFADDANGKKRSGGVGGFNEMELAS